MIVRKTLTPLHGVFRVYQTMLALYAFTTWAAKLTALRRGRAAVTEADVREAVRLIEQRFVLHARFADVFTLSPVLTLVADRLFRDPAFVRGGSSRPNTAETRRSAGGVAAKTAGKMLTPRAAAP